MSIFKKFLTYYKPYRKIFYIDMFCALIVSIIDVAFPQILRLLSYGLFSEAPKVIYQNLPSITCILLVAIIIRMLTQYYITNQGHVMGAKMESDMRENLFYHLQKLSFSYYDQNNTGEMMSKIVSDLFDIGELAHHGPENIVISLLKIIGSFSLMMMINVPMTLILLVITIIMAVFSIYNNKKMHSVFMDNRKEIAYVNSQVQDSLAGIHVVKGFGNEHLEYEKFFHSNLRFLKSKESSYKVLGSFRAGASFLEGLLFISVLISGGLFIANGSISLTDLAVYALYINIIINPINILIEFTEMFQKGYSGFKRFIEVIETKPEIVDNKNAVELNDFKGNIEYKDVSFSYDSSNKVLEHINIKIESGKKVAIVGPSGGGKTTLCSLLPRFYDVTNGSVTIDGIDVRNIKLKSLRKAIGIVQQDVYMFSGSIKENIAYGKPNATDDEIIQAAKNANIHDFIAGLEDGYDTYAGERGVRLSGGQKQRLSIARIFLKNPNILILDEATSALDNESERHIQQSLEKLAKNRTAIVIAHRLSTIRNADEIIVIDDDGIQERGTHKELINKNGIYAKYYNMQFEGLN